MPDTLPGEKDARFFLIVSLQNREHIAKMKRQHDFALDS
jgi:hypothetical protein